jgi:hypothetical protein
VGTEGSRKPPAWLITQILVLVILAALVWADREYWHWYSGSGDTSNSANNLIVPGLAAD